MTTMNCIFRLSGVDAPDACEKPVASVDAKFCATHKQVVEPFYRRYKQLESVFSLEQQLNSVNLEQYGQTKLQKLAKLLRNSYSRAFASIQQREWYTEHFVAPKYQDHSHTAYVKLIRHRLKTIEDTLSRIYTRIAALTGTQQEDIKKQQKDETTETCKELQRGASAKSQVVGHVDVKQNKSKPKAKKNHAMSSQQVADTISDPELNMLAQIALMERNFVIYALNRITSLVSGHFLESWHGMMRGCRLPATLDDQGSFLHMRSIYMNSLVTRLLKQQVPPKLKSLLLGWTRYGCTIAQEKYASPELFSQYLLNDDIDLDIATALEKVTQSQWSDVAEIFRLRVTEQFGSHLMPRMVTSVAEMYSMSDALSNMLLTKQPHVPRRATTPWSEWAKLDTDVKRWRVDHRFSAAVVPYIRTAVTCSLEQWLALVEDLIRSGQRSLIEELKIVVSVYELLKTTIIHTVSIEFEHIEKVIILCEPFKACVVCEKDHGQTTPREYTRCRFCDVLSCTSCQLDCDSPTRVQTCDEHRLSMEQAFRHLAPVTPGTTS